MYLSHILYLFGENACNFVLIFKYNFKSILPITFMYYYYIKYCNHQAVTNLPSKSIQAC